MPFSKTGAPHPFRKVLTKKNRLPSPLKFDHVYVFFSLKKLKYIVNIHQYDFGVCAVKFNLKRNSQHKNKYKVLAKQPDTAKILKTIIAIMVDYTVNVDATTSFAFIGMSSLNEDSENTKRFRVYRTLSQRYFNIDNYVHKEDKKKSLYMILNKKKNVDEIHSFLMNCIDSEMVAEFSDNTINPFSIAS